MKQPAYVHQLSYHLGGLTCMNICKKNMYTVSWSHVETHCLKQILVWIQVCLISKYLYMEVYGGSQVGGYPHIIQVMDDHDLVLKQPWSLRDSPLQEIPTQWIIQSSKTWPCIYTGATSAIKHISFVQAERTHLQRNQSSQRGHTYHWQVFCVYIVQYLYIYIYAYVCTIWNVRVHHQQLPFTFIICLAAHLITKNNVRALF